MSPSPRPGSPLLAALLLALLPTGLPGQEEKPPPPDTLPRPDTLARDTGRAAGGQEAADSVAGEEPVVPFVRFGEAVEEGWGAGVWTWDRRELELSRAFTVGELLSEVPGILHLRGGAPGMPEAATAFGLGPGRIRVFLDGFELDPMDHSALELSRVQLGGLEAVRVERRPGELRVELRTLSPFDARPYSKVVAGTGDLNSNFFRGSFAKPNSLGGNLSLGIDRFESAGTRGAQPGTLFGGWMKYALVGDRGGGVELELRSRRTDRDTVYAPPEVSRTDWVVRARGRVGEGVVAGVYVGGSGTGVGEGDDEGVAAGGGTADGPDGVRSEGVSGRQAGALVTVDRGPVWSRGALRFRDRAGRPDLAADLAAGIRLGGIVAADVEGSWEEWDPRSATGVRVRGIVGPVLGLRLFADRSWGERGIFDVARARRSVRFEPRFDDRTATRVGASLTRGRLAVGGAALAVEADSLRPLGFPPDDGGVVTDPGGEITGWEAFGTVPVPFVRGLRLEGTGQFWEEGRRLRYLPRRTWRMGARYHRTFLESGNLELLVRLGAEGRSEMAVPLAAAGEGNGGGAGDGEEGAAPVLAVVPPYESWSMHLQIRVVGVRIFIRWENLTSRIEQRDFPGRLLPGQWASYGVKWTLWN